MTKLHEQIAKTIFDAFGNATLTWGGLLASIQKSEPRIKNVYGIRKSGEITTVIARMHSRELVIVNIRREERHVDYRWHLGLTDMKTELIPPTR